MAKITVKEIQNKESWERFVLSRNPQSFLHSWNWGEANKDLGKKVFRLGFFENNKLVGVCLMIKEDAKRGPHFVIPAGPIIDWTKRNLQIFFLKTIKEFAERESVWFIRVRPELLDTSENKRLFSKMGFISAPMHLHAENTWVLDISQSEETLLSGMRKSTRYSVRKGLNEGLVIKLSENPDDWSVLNKLQKVTAERHHFVAFSPKLFQYQLENFSKDNQATLFICTKGKKAMVAAIIIFYGNFAYYHHSGSSSEAGRNYSSYFTQWEIIKEAKRRGLKYYNFWGVAPEGQENSHRFGGVTLFKTGFGGKRVDWLHAQDLLISPLYWFTYCFESVRRMIRGL